MVWWKMTSSIFLNILIILKLFSFFDVFDRLVFLRSLGCSWALESDTAHLVSEALLAQKGRVHLVARVRSRVRIVGQVQVSTDSWSATNASGAHLNGVVVSLWAFSAEHRKSFYCRLAAIVQVLIVGVLSRPNDSVLRDAWYLPGASLLCWVLVCHTLALRKQVRRTVERNLATNFSRRWAI